jgi:hypothetical protein
MPDAVWMQYVSDDGTTYQRRTWDDIRAAVGNAADTPGAHARLPSNIKPRYVLGQDANGHQHKLVVGSATNGAFTGATTTLTAPDPNNRGTGTISLNLMGRIAEKRYRR